MLNSSPIFFIDCQSTGASFINSQILEVACNDRSWVLNQKEPVPRKILRLIGISHEEVEQGFNAEQVFRELSSLIGESAKQFQGDMFAVSHFARFEKAHLDRLWQTYAKQPFPIPMICTHKLAKLLFPQLPNYGIRALAGWFGMPLDDGKRASNHVVATQQIWSSLAKTLAERGVTTLDQLQVFINQKSARAPRRKEFLIPRETRLSLPTDPGVYRYVDRSGRILYVGKATSLKARVNSYFTGGCRGDHRKLEMLAQAVDVNVTPTKAPIFAGLLEYDEIRRHKPPYNIAFKGIGRDPLKDLNLLTGTLADLSPAKFSGTVKECFYGLTDFQSLIDGVSLWRSHLAISPETVLTQRALLNLAIPLLKSWIIEEQKRLKIAETGSSKDQDFASDVDESTDESVDDTKETVWTVELVAETCQRIIRRALRHYIRAKWLKRLAGASIELSTKTLTKPSRKNATSSFIIEHSSEETAADLRRVRVLLHELRRADARGGSWKILKPWPMTVPFWI